MSTTRQGAHGAINGLGPNPVPRPRSAERSRRPTKVQLACRWSGAVTLLLATGAGAHLVWNKISEAVDNANKPLPAGCEATVRPGGSAWGIAEQIAAHPELHARTGDVLTDLERTNPGVNLGQVVAWQSIEVPEMYCYTIADDGTVLPVR